MSLRKTITVFFSVTIITAACYADPNSLDTYTDVNPGWQVGGGVLIIDRPYRGVDADIFPLPFAQYLGKNWSLRGPNFEYKLSPADAWKVRTILRMRTDGFDADDSSELDGMGDRDSSLDAGLGFTYSLPGRWGKFDLDGLTDILGKSKGQEIRLRYVKPFSINKARLTPFIGLSWRSSQLNNYYYGVRDNEARPGRPQYEADDAAQMFIGLATNYQLSEKWSAFAMFRNEWLADEITDSPIVDQHYSVSILVGLVHLF